MASRNALINGNDTSLLNQLLPLKTYDILKKQSTKSGNAAYREIIDDAEKRIAEFGCFVAGTLVHTREGLRPIEEIKVGDYVLSKPESGVGEASYKRVSRTFEYDDKEVWFVHVVVLDSAYNWTSSLDYFIATGNHPIWVKGYKRDGVYHEVNNWESVRDLGKDEYAYGGGAILELFDGRIVAVFTHGGLLAKTGMQNIGIINTDSLWDDCVGSGVNFENNQNIYLFEAELDLEDQSYNDNDALKGSVGADGRGFPPLLRKVYNLEVEENHTYYVGETGVLVSAH